MSLTPVVRVKHDKSETTVLVELPGCPKDNTNISVRPDIDEYGRRYGLLSVSSKTGSSVSNKCEYECVIDINGYSDSDAYEASMSDGLLEIKITTVTNNKKIEIK